MVILPMIQRKGPLNFPRWRTLITALFLPFPVDKKNSTSSSFPLSTALWRQPWWSLLWNRKLIRPWWKQQHCHHWYLNPATKLRFPSQSCLRIWLLFTLFGWRCFSKLIKQHLLSRSSATSMSKFILANICWKHLIGSFYRVAIFRFRHLRVIRRRSDEHSVQAFSTNLSGTSRDDNTRFTRTVWFIRLDKPSQRIRNAIRQCQLQVNWQTSEQRASILHSTARIWSTR